VRYFYCKIAKIAWAGGFDPRSPCFRRLGPQTPSLWRMGASSPNPQ